MKRCLRLRKTTDFERVRRAGRSCAHPLVVLVSRPNSLPIVRIGVSAGRSVGNAVQRNRAKRRLRALAAGLLPEIKAGHDLVLLARKPILKASAGELDFALRSLLDRSRLLKSME